MAPCADIALENVSSPTRAPLIEKSNSPPPVPIPSKQVRRKNSFIRRIDSSEEIPSSHDSIYEAYHFSNTNSDESVNGNERFGLGGVDMTISNAENIRVIQNPEFRYGNGTILQTITEQKSTGTISSLFRPKSVDDLRDTLFLAHRDSFIVARNPRRKRSFSVSDLELISQSYHDACTMIEKMACKPSPIHEIYASPKVPVRDPLERPPTPPGMPSWTAAQTLPRLIVPRRQQHHRTPNRLQRYFGLQPSGITSSSRIPHPRAPRIVSTPVNVARSRVAPRFRPPRSTYGHIDRHPFNNCPVAPSPQFRSSNRKVRFTPSATARDSAEMHLRTAIESSTASALHPMSPIRSMMPVIPVAQTEPAIKRQRVCLHRKNFIPTTVSVDSNAVETCITAENSRHNSVSSTAHIMSGAISPQTSPVVPGDRSPLVAANPNVNHRENGNETTKKPRKSVTCWKCLIKSWIERAGRIWTQAPSCLCFVCCGFECDDESVAAPYGVHGLASGSGYFDNQDAESLRRHALAETPASIF